MAEWQLRTPVAFIIFNRADTTERVFEAIAKARPPKLLVIGDGARDNRLGEADRVAATRAIIDRVDWECEVLTNFSERNLGCKRRVSSGIDWVFEQVEEAIILEDDCLPEPSFFRYCEELLEKYRDDHRVCLIGGTNVQSGLRHADSSYYFSRYPHIWGWASWRRAWQCYDVKMSDWPRSRREGWLREWLGSRSQETFWRMCFDRVSSGEIDTWDYQWVYACWKQRMFAITPDRNLIANIGFRPDATHTTGESQFADMPVTAMGFPLQHPACVALLDAADAVTARVCYSEYPLWKSVLIRCWLMVRKYVRH